MLAVVVDVEVFRVGSGIDLVSDRVDVDIVGSVVGGFGHMQVIFFLVDIILILYILFKVSRYLFVPKIKSDKTKKKLSFLTFSGMTSTILNQRKRNLK